MSLYIVTNEDDEGMWFDHPIGGDTADEVRRIARENWPWPPEGCKLVLYKCEQVEEIDTSAGVSSKGATDEKGHA